VRRLTAPDLRGLRRCLLCRGNGVAVDRRIRSRQYRAQRSSGYAGLDGRLAYFDCVLRHDDLWFLHVDHVTLWSRGHPVCPDAPQLVEDGREIALCPI
jgi:hypothetical protein